MSVESEMACVGQATDRWILQLSEEAIGQLGGAHSAPQLLAQAGLPLRVLSGLGIAGQLAAETVGLPETDVSHLLKASPLIEWFEKDKVVNAQLTPNDPRYLTNEQSALLALSPEDASNASLLRRVIDAPRAWDLSFGKRDAIVAVIDSGIDLNHVDLASNIWRNPLENPNNDLDDDGNGYVDDVKGFDFVDDDNDTTDENGHGTAVAGIIGAKGNNNVGIAGVNWNASILPVRYLNAENQGSVSDAIAAINYVRKTKQQGANIRAINASWGFYGDFSQGLYDAIQGAGQEGILFVAAAGNGNSLGRGIDLDQEGTPFYPASFDLDNIITVAAAAPDGRLAGFSNYGQTTVDVLAPGVDILTTAIDDGYEARTGTSFATPFVTGVAGLILGSQQGNQASVSELRDAILQSVVNFKDLTGVVSSEGNLNTFRALKSDVFAPRATAFLGDADNILTETKRYRLVVKYLSDVGVDPTSIGTGDIFVRRGNFLGSPQIATLVEDPLEIRDKNGKLFGYKAIYEIQIQDSADNGDYEVIVKAGEVLDLNRVAAPEKRIGQFKVEVADPNLIVVNSTADFPNIIDRNGDGILDVSLRAAIRHSNQTPGNQTILVPDGDYRLTTVAGVADSLTGDLDVFQPMRVVASGSDFTTISALAKDRVFDIKSNGGLRLEGVTVTAGRAGWGAGIFNAGILELKRSVLVGNRAGEPGDAEAFGAGLANMNVASIIESTIINNAAVSTLTTKGGGGVYNEGKLLIEGSSLIDNGTFAGLQGAGGGGGLHNAQGGSVRIVNTTFSANRVTNGNGGGIYNAGVAYLNHVTIADNEAFRTGGLFNVPTGELEIENSIVARSQRIESDSPVLDVDGVFVSRGDNIFGSAPAVLVDRLLATDLAGMLDNPVDPKIGDLANNGGSTLTYRITADSPALNEGHTTVVVDINGNPVLAAAGGQIDLLVDQIGNTRDPRMQGGARPDIGAFERFRGVISGRVYEDLDGDGRIDPNEPGRAGLQLFLDMDDDGLLDSNEPVTVSQNDDPATPRDLETGQYSFLSPPDTYDVRLVVPTGFVPTTNVVVPADANIPVEYAVDNVLDVSIRGVRDDLRKLGAPSINESGTVAFFAQRVDPADITQTRLQTVIYAGSNGQFQRFVVGGANPERDGVRITQGGFLVFARQGSQGGVYEIRPEETRTIVRRSTLIPGTTTPFGNVAFREPRNASALTLFHTAATMAGQRVGVYVGSGPGSLRTLADNETFLEAIQKTLVRFESTAFESQDYAFLAADAESQFGIYSTSIQGTLGVVADNNTPVPNERGRPLPSGARFDLSRYPTGLAIFDGEVAFYGNDTTGRRGVYVGNAAGLRRVAGRNTLIPGRDESFLSFGGQSRNLALGEGSVLFLGYGANNRAGVYLEVTEPDGRRSIRKIMDTDDLIGTQRPVDFKLSSGSLIDRRLIAFTAILPAGREVVVTATLPLGSEHSDIGLGASQELAGFNFGVQAQAGTLRGMLFLDADADGAFDEGEQPLTEGSVYLDQNNNQQRDLGEQAAIVDEQGQYAFTGLASFATYFVRQIVPANLVQTFPSAANGSWIVDLQPGATVGGLNFGDTTADALSGVGNVGVLSGTVKTQSGLILPNTTVYIDANHNGILDFTERSTRTNLAGVYRFGGLPAGVYDVRLLDRPDSMQIMPFTNTFRQTQPVTPSEPPTAIAVANVDGKNGTDLILTTQNKVIIVLNNGGGVYTLDPAQKNILWKEIEIDQSTHTSVTVGNFVGSSLIDIAVGSLHGDSVLVLENIGLGQGPVPFDQARIKRLTPGLGLEGRPTYSETRDILGADFNNDGKTDIATANDMDIDAVYVYLNSATGLKAARVFQAGSKAFAISAADFDPPSNPSVAGFLDLAVANFGDRTITLLKNVADGTSRKFVFVKKITVGNGPSSIARGDFNNDGRADLAVTNYNSDTVTILIANGNFSFRPAVTRSVPTGATSLITQDIDGDGDIDLVVSSGKRSDSGGISVLRNLTGDGTFGAAETQGVGLVGDVDAYYIAIGQIDGSQLVDVVVANGFSGNVSVLTNRVSRTGGYTVEIAPDRTTYEQLHFVLRPNTAIPRVDLVPGPAGDNGPDTDDNITSLNNSSTSTRLTFRVLNTVPGARVVLYADDTPIGIVTAAGTATTVVTNGRFRLTDGSHLITATQEEPNKPVSLPSPALRIVVRTTTAAATMSDDLFSLLGSTGGLLASYDEESSEDSELPALLDS